MKIRKHINKADIAICLVLIGILIIFCLQLPGIKEVARIYPIVVISGSFLMIAIILFQAIFCKEVELEDEKENEKKLEKSATVRIILYCLAILAYIILIPYMGFLISTILFVVFSLIFQGNKNKLLLILLPILLSVVMYYIFKEFLMVKLPFGEWMKTILK